MFFLILAILGSAGVSLVMRTSIPHVKNNVSMLAAGYLSCTLLAVLHTLLSHNVWSRDGASAALLLGALAGVLLLAGFLALQKNVQLNGVVLAGIFSKLGVLVPILLSVIFFRERPALVQCLGFVLAIIAIILIHSDKGGSKARSKAALLLLLLTNGLADAMSKIYNMVGTASMREFYLLFSFFSAFVLCVLLALTKKQKLAPADVGFGLLLGIPNYYSLRFLMMALTELPAVVAYPTCSVGTIVVISLVGLLVFKEKLSRRQVLAIFIILAALVLLNL